MKKKFVIHLTDYERQTLYRGLYYLYFSASDVPSEFRTPLCKMILRSFSRLSKKLSK